MEPEGGRRRDAEANRQALLDAAAELLAVDPDAGVAEIAEHAGLGRTTAYRHFPSRKALFDGLAADVVGRRNAGIEAATARDPDIGAVLRAAAAIDVEFGARYPFFFAHRTIAGPALQEASLHGGDSLTVFLAGARDRGEIRDDQPLRWLMATQLAISLAMIGELLAGRVPRDEAAPLLGETLITLMAPR